MQAAHNVELGDRLAPALARALPHLFERHGVGLGIAHALAESAQAATGHADVGGVDVAVHIEIRNVAVEPLAHQVGQVAECQDVGSAVEREAVFEGEPLARLHLAADRDKTGIVDYHLHTSGTRFKEEYISSPEKKE